MKIPLGAALGLLLLTAALAPSCSPADVTDPLAKACDDYAFALCSRLATCSSIAIQNRFGTAAVCEALYKAQCVDTGSAPGSGTTAATTAACTQALPSWSCPDFVLSLNPPPACQPVPGGRPNGAPCAVRQQCQSAFCSYVNAQDCGTCAPLPKAGASCAQTNCAVGYSCAGTPPVCQPYALLGAMCGSGITCADGLTCVGVSGSAPGTCQPGVTTLGAPCSFSGAGCDFNSGLACNAAKGTCQTVKLSPPGGPCGTVGDQPTSCAAGACVRGVCVAYPLRGAPCDLDGPGCMNTAHCVIADGGTHGTCQIRGDNVCE